MNFSAETEKGSCSHFPSAQSTCWTLGLKKFVQIVASMQQKVYLTQITGMEQWQEMLFILARLEEL